MAGETEGAPNTETAPLPESTDIAGAVALMADLPEDDGDTPPPDPNARPRKEKPAAEKPAPEARADDAGDSENDEAVEDDSDDAGEDEDAEDDAGEDDDAGDEQPAADAPEFWSAEDKAAWKDVPEKLRPVLAKYEQARIEHVKGKEREAAEKVKTADGAAKQLHEVVAANAAWWQQAGPKLNGMFTDKWTTKLKENGVATWGELAEQNPGEWARLSQQFNDERAAVIEANQRGDADRKAAQAREADEQNARIQTQKAEAHQVMLKKYPKEFANVDEIYNKKLGPYMVSQGIPVDRVNAISEAPILEIAYKAFLYDEGQKAKTQASAVLAGKKPAGTQPQTPTESATPTRVAPGPPARGANRQGEASRQVSERFRRTGSIADGAELIRLNGL